MGRTRAWKRPGGGGSTRRTRTAAGRCRTRLRARCGSTSSARASLASGSPCGRCGRSRPLATMPLPDPPIDWLLAGEPWVEYRTRLDLLGQSEKDTQVKSARSAMLADAGVRNLLTELSGWPGTVLSSHKSASHPFHKLTFVADLGP